MSGGFDPMDELSATLEALEPATQRRVKVAPPPVDDFTGALDRPEDDEATDAGEKALTPEEDTSKGDTAGGSDPAEVEPAVVPASRS